MSLRELVQMVSHLVIGGPERQKRKYKEIKLVGIPEQKKQGRIQPMLTRYSRNAVELETPNTLERESLPPHTIARKVSLPIPKKIYPVEGEPEAIWAGTTQLSWDGVRLLTETVGIMRKSTHRVMRPLVC